MVHCINQAHESKQILGTGVVDPLDITKGGKKELYMYVYITGWYQWQFLVRVIIMHEGVQEAKILTLCGATKVDICDQ